LLGEWDFATPILLNIAVTQAILEKLGLGLDQASEDSF
jgi:hypothetical protein